MKLIMENWRKYLSEGMKTADDLPNGIVITIDTDPKYGDGEGGVLFYFAKAETPSEFIGWDSGLQGEIRIEPVQLNDEYPCDNGFMVAYSDATKGWGPLLYDIAIEYATLMGNGLMSDRTEVSDEAYAVWDYYLKSRSDVIKSQTDSEGNGYSTNQLSDENIASSTTASISVSCFRPYRIRNN